MSLKLARDLALPLDAATQTCLVVGKRGSGKTTTCVRLAEQFHKAGVPIVVVDPVDVWYGLKAARDGKCPGLKVYVFGGRHGDLPIEPTAGALLADVLVEHRISAVLSIKHFSGRERNRFVADFMARLFRRNTEPIHLFLEEAHEIAPQNPYKGEEEMLGHVQRLWKLGRSSGIGGSAITQRPASLNKNVTTQAEILIVHRTLGPQDVAAIREWIRYHGEREDILAQLATLRTGEAFVWAPDFPEGRPIGLQRVQILDRETFDSSATPKAGERRTEPKTLATVDLERLGKQMAATIERAKQEDPRELRRQIADLKTQVAKAQTKTAAVPMVKAHRVEVPVIQAKQIQQLTALAKRLDAHRQTFDRLVEYREALGEVSRCLWTRLEKIASARGAEAPKQSEGSVEVIPAASKTQRFEGSERGELGKCEGKVLQVLAQHPAGCRIGKLALLSGYRVSGGFRNALTSLRTQGLITGPNTGTMIITAEGRHAIAGRYDPLPHGRALIDYWLQHPSMGKCEREVLRVLVDVYPQGLSIEALAKKSCYEVSGGFRNALSRLRTVGVLEGRNTEAMRTSRELLGW